MLTLFRWHTKRCPHDSRDYIKCQCPIWMDWTLPDGQRVRKSLGLKDWQAAQRRARDMEAEGIATAGETITIDAERNEISVDVPADELQRRRAAWKMPPYKAERGTLAKYIRLVKNASNGCVTDEI